MSQNSRKKRVLWRNNEIDYLLNVWDEYADDLRRVKRTAKIYEFISRKLNENNIEKSPIEVSFKIGNMTKKFRSIERNILVESGDCSDWPYFERVKCIIGQFPFNDDPLVQQTTSYMDFNDMSLQSQLTEGSSTLAMSTPGKDTSSETVASEDSESSEILPTPSNNTPGIDRSSEPLCFSEEALPGTSTSTTKKRRIISLAEDLLHDGKRSSHNSNEEDFKAENERLCAQKYGQKLLKSSCNGSELNDYYRTAIQSQSKCKPPELALSKFKQHNDILFLEQLMASRQTNMENHNITKSLEYESKQKKKQYCKCRLKKQVNESKRKRTQNGELMKLQKEAYNRNEFKVAVERSINNQINRPTNPGLYNFFISLYETSVNFPSHIQCQLKKKFFNIISDYEEQLIAPSTSTTSYNISSLASKSNCSQQSIDEACISTSSFPGREEEVLLSDMNKTIEENDVKPDLQTLFLT